MILFVCQGQVPASIVFDPIRVTASAPGSLFPALIPAWLSVDVNRRTEEAEPGSADRVSPGSGYYTRIDTSAGGGDPSEVVIERQVSYFVQITLT